MDVRLFTNPFSYFTDRCVLCAWPGPVDCRRFVWPTPSIDDRRKHRPRVGGWTSIMFAVGRPGRDA